MPIPRAAVEHAKAAREALAALDDLDPAQLARRPEDVYALLDHLSMVVSPLWRISAELGRLLDQWADQRGLPRPTGEALCALHVAADRLQAEAPPHAMRLYGVLDAAQHALDPTTYRSHYGLEAAVRREQQTPPAAQACTGKVRYHAPGPATAAAGRTTRGRTGSTPTTARTAPAGTSATPPARQRRAARTATRNADTPHDRARPRHRNHRPRGPNAHDTPKHDAQRRPAPRRPRPDRGPTPHSGTSTPGRPAPTPATRPTAWPPGCVCSPGTRSTGAGSTSTATPPSSPIGAPSRRRPRTARPGLLQTPTSSSTSPSMSRRTRKLGERLIKRAGRRR